METFSALLVLCAGIHRSQVNSPHKGQWRGALMFSLICAWISGWVNNREAGDLRRHRAHCDVILMRVWFGFDQCYMWGLVCQRWLSMIGTKVNIPQILWDVMTCLEPWYRFLAKQCGNIHRFCLFVCLLGLNGLFWLIHVRLIHNH